MKLSFLNRKVHRWGAILIALPLVLVIVSGLMLQVKKQVTWVQPETKKGSGKTPKLGMDELLAAVKGVPEAEVKEWGDIDRVDLRPKDGIYKVTCKNRYEVQVDFATGDVLSVAERHSDLIESVHDGSILGDGVKLGVFLPAAVVLLVLWVTGLILFCHPLWVKWRRKKPKASEPGA
jgi:uncharacterized iron-regulated membrane protein